MVNKINLKLSCGGNGKSFKKEIDLPSVINFIESKHINDEIKARLIKIAKNYPASALKKFCQNINNYIKVAQDEEKSSS